ncbi:MAG: hypothetical protein BWY09_01593 [Candidatus Hydrogenedentes bacterium ADurb.Bin179]|nr:MAG: hypothetical protein BWY09_01593 [Candidatus Hydrogenedentes bacterium ADurb.Bin179]
MFIPCGFLGKTIEAAIRKVDRVRTRRQVTLEDHPFFPGMKCFLARVDRIIVVIMVENIGSDIALFIHKHDGTKVLRRTQMHIIIVVPAIADVVLVGNVRRGAVPGPHKAIGGHEIPRQRYHLAACRGHAQIRFPQRRGHLKQHGVGIGGVNALGGICYPATRTARPRSAEVGFTAAGRRRHNIAYITEIGGIRTTGAASASRPPGGARSTAWRRRTGRTRTTKLPVLTFHVVWFGQGIVAAFQPRKPVRI